MKLTIISGGQTGVDQVALELAKAYGFPTGGTAPYGYRTDDGPNFALRDVYGLKESPYLGYRIRTVQNVCDADQTVWFGDTGSPGGKLTCSTARRLGKPLSINPDAETLLKLLQTSYEVRVLNVAGDRVRTNPVAWKQAQVVLGQVLRALRDAEAQ